MSDDRDGGLVQAFLSLGPDSNKVFRLFSRGNQPGCYVLGQWASYVAKEYIKSAAVIKHWSTNTDGQAIDVVIVNDAMSREVIRDCLLRNGVSVEFYDRAPGGGSYVCVQRGSPGNIADFETTLFEFEEAEIQLLATGSLVLEAATGGGGSAVTIGFAALNTTLRQVQFAEYTDNLQLSNLDALVAQTNLKELVLCVDSTSGSESDERVAAVRRICERAGVSFSIVSYKDLKKTAKSANPLDTLQEILRVPEEKIALLPCRAATKAVENILDKLDAMDSTNSGAFYLRRVNPASFMRLDSAAIEALNLVSKKPEAKGSLPQSVFSWLNRCHTGMGARAMRQWLLQPLRQVEDIAQRQRMVEILVDNPVLRDRLVAEVLKPCSDMDRLNRKLQRRHLQLKDTQAFLNFVAIIPRAIEALKTYTGRDSKMLRDEYVAPLEDIEEHMGNLQTLIKATVDFSDRNAARINPAFDDDLQELHQQLLSLQKEVDKEYRRALKSYDWNEKQLKSEYHSSYGYVFRVSRKEDRQVRESKELVIVNTAKDGVRFASERLTTLSEQYKGISADYEKRQQDLKTKLVDTIASYLPVLDDAKELFAALDVFASWSLVVKESPRPMVRPTLHAAAAGSSSGGTEKPVKSECPAAVLSLKNVRHPLVEARQPNFVANSVRLEQSGNALIITGPNMGGKSTFMRSVGVAVVLAQAGCFVPADAAEVQVRDAVMCRVGATDHLAQGVSTFMVEMLESAAIVASATSETLAIVDELGRGTSTYDGFGLAWSIAKEIASKIRATLLFSTHFHELTQLPEECPNVRNMHFGADVNEEEGTLRFSYRLEPGPCGRSYGLYVAALAHLPAEVVADAKVKAAELESFDSANGSPALDDELRKEVTRYAKRVRELEHETDPTTQQEGRKRLRAEIQSNVRLATLLSA